MASSTRRFACAVLCVFASSEALADHQPVLVVPGRAGVPVMIDGYDASWAVVYGDTGLYRPGHVAPQIMGPALIAPVFTPGGYYPSTGRPPRAGRREVDPARGRAASDRDFYRSWGVRSEPTPVTIPPPSDPPAVIVAPGGRAGFPPRR